MEEGWRENIEHGFEEVQVLGQPVGVRLLGLRGRDFFLGVGQDILSLGQGILT